MSRDRNLESVGRFLKEQTSPWISDNVFHEDVSYLEALWQRKAVGALDMPIIDVGAGEPLVFVPILEHLEFVYSRQVRELSKQHRVILYRRHESRSQKVGLPERVEELRSILDSLGIAQSDLVAHGDAAMVLFAFAARYPERCRSLTLIAQGADYQIAPHPFIWLLHELYLRLPVESILPASFLRRTVIRYIVAHDKENQTTPALPMHLIAEQFRKIQLWPYVYKFSVLPTIHFFDMRQQLQNLTMPILLINRADDRLSPEEKTRWLAEHLPISARYYVISGRERFFMYSQAEQVTPLLANFLTEVAGQLVK